MGLVPVIPAVVERREEVLPVAEPFIVQAVGEVAVVVTASQHDRVLQCLEYVVGVRVLVVVDVDIGLGWSRGYEHRVRGVGHPERYVTHENHELHVKVVDDIHRFLEGPVLNNLWVAFVGLVLSAPIIEMRVGDGRDPVVILELVNHLHRVVRGPRHRRAISHY